MRVYKIELLMKRAKISTEMRRTVPAALAEAARECGPAAAIELPDGSIETGKTSNLLGASAALFAECGKSFRQYPHGTHLISPTAIEPIQKLKVDYLEVKILGRHTDEVLIALSMCAATDKMLKSPWAASKAETLPGPHLRHVV